MLSENEVNRALLSRTAAILLGFAAVLSVCAIMLRYWDFDWYQLSIVQREALSWGGAAAAVGVATLLLGMWLFWVKCDRSSERARRIWFFVLLIGLPFGALPYYMFVYLPAVRRHQLEPGGGSKS